MGEAKIDDILNYVHISERVGSAGQPRREQFAAVARAGYEVVVNLAMPDSTNALPDEAELVAAQGMSYVHIPVAWEAPTIQDLERFFEVLERYGDRKVFVHCALNMRVSVFLFLYRVLQQGVPQEGAWRAVRRIWEPNDVWQGFMARSLRTFAGGAGANKPVQE